MLIYLILYQASPFSKEKGLFSSVKEKRKAQSFFNSFLRVRIKSVERRFGLCHGLRQ